MYITYILHVYYICTTCQHPIILFIAGRGVFHEQKQGQVLKQLITTFRGRINTGFIRYINHIPT